MRMSSNDYHDFMNKGLINHISRGEIVMEFVHISNLRAVQYINHNGEVIPLELATKVLESGEEPVLHTRIRRIYQLCSYVAVHCEEGW